MVSQKSLFGQCEAGAAPLLRCPGCGASGVTANRRRVLKSGESVAGVYCRACKLHLGDLPPEGYALFKAGPDVHHDQQLPKAGGHWLGLVRDRLDCWQPVAVAETLPALWDLFLCQWIHGDLLAVHQDSDCPVEVPAVKERKRR